jgi:hypothetical protein
MAIRSQRTAGRLVWSLVGCLVLALILASCGNDSPSEGTESTTSVELDSFVQQAGEFVVNLTGMSPGEGDVYESTRGEALEAVGSGSVAESASSARVYLVSFTGDFSLIGASRPEGVEAPQAKQVVVIIDATTGDMLDYGGLLDPVDLSIHLDPIQQGVVIETK